MNTHNLVIAGQHLTVRSPADAAYVRVLAGMVDSRVRAAAGQGARPAGGVLLVALGLADELMKMKAEANRLRQEIDLRAGAILSVLDAPTNQNRGA